MKYQTTTLLTAPISQIIKPWMMRILALCCFVLYGLQSSAQDLSVELSADIVICQGESAVFNSTVIGGSGSYTYAWTPATGLSCTDCPNPIANPDVTTTYTLTVDDGVDQAQDNVIVTVHSIVVTSASITDVACAGEATGSIDLNVSGDFPLTYLWSNGVTTQANSNLSADVYTVIITDNNGCQTEESYTIAEAPPLFVTTTTTDATCNNSDGNITIVITGGTPPYLYSWSDGSTGPNILGVGPGTYCITITDTNGCSVEDCAIVETDENFDILFDFVGELNCEGDSGTLVVTPDGGTAPFTYQWSDDNGNPIAFTQDITAFAGQTYTAQVASSEGCLAEATYRVPNPLATSNLASTVFLDCNSSTILLDGSLDQPSLDYSYTWTIGGTVISNNPTLSVDAMGLYTLEIEHTSGCISARTVEVLSFTDSNNVSISVTPTGCNQYELGINWPAPPIPNTQYAWLWRLPSGGTISGQPTIVPTETGVYQLEVIETVSVCYKTVALYIDLEQEVCGIIRGRIARDDNQDCVVDASEAGISGWIVQAEDSFGTYYSLADANGFYQFSLPLGVYEITPIPSSSAWELCDASYSLSLTANGQIQEQDIPAQREVNCPELSIDINALLLRRCFSGRYAVQVCNLGTETAIAPVVYLNLDPFLTFISAGIPATVNGQEVSLSIPDLAAGDCANYFVYVDVSCDATLGQTHCTLASVTPDSLCAPANTAWSGASLEVSGTCDGNEVSFVISNEGDGALDEPVHYIVIEDGVMLMQASEQILNLPSLGDTTITLPANGSTYTIIIDQANFHPFTTTLTSFVEGCTSEPGGSFSTGFANQFGANTNSIASDIDCTENVGSYDPNDKLAMPAGYGDDHYIFPDQAIDYRIRFQNTGTDTAFTVVVRDELSEFLDISTLELGSSSHSYRAAFQDQRTLVFTFDNIMLPDSNVNLEGSNGFVNYRISPKRDIPLETVIENGAAIYFDFNDPVLTPVIFHTVSDNFLEVVATVAPQVPGLQLDLFPNPTAGELQLHLDGSPNGIRRLVWYDALGRALGEEQFAGNHYQTKVPAQEAGWYFFRLFVEDQWVASGKVGMVRR